jgi:uncharacterized protein
MTAIDDLLASPKQRGRRQLLALDGGGIRGMITLGILEKLEADLSTATGKGSQFRFSDYFDFIGGTSTGAILAAGLSIGMSVAELLKFYQESGFCGLGTSSGLTHLRKNCNPFSVLIRNLARIASGPFY